MATAELVITARVKGMWRVVLLGWAIKLWRLGPEHVEVTIDSSGR